MISLSEILFEHDILVSVTVCQILRIIKLIIGNEFDQVVHSSMEPHNIILLYSIGIAILIFRKKSFN